MKYLFLLFISAFLLINCAPKEELDARLSSGKIERVENFASNYINARNIDVWLPDDYNDDQKYAVLYMHDGQMLFDSMTTWNKQEWGVDEIMSTLLTSADIRNTIVVAIWNTEYRHSEYFPQKPFESLPKQFQDSLINHGKRNGTNPLFKSGILSDNYLKFIVTELKPYIDKKYSTLPDPNNTFIAGSSMGGLISMYAICEYPEVFSGAACLSTHWVGTFDTVNNPIPNAFANYLEQNLPDFSTHRIYFDYGTETLDALYEPYQNLVDSIMIKNGFTSTNWKTLKFDGADHSERAWSRRLNIPLQFLLPKA
ncbi:MAG: alpha/beta hydrolase-fold protein [Bacteroidota bacterium]